MEGEFKETVECLGLNLEAEESENEVSQENVDEGLSVQLHAFGFGEIIVLCELEAED